jgi:ribokinase
LPVAFIGKVGIDPFGRMARENLGAEGVKTHLVESPNYSTEAVAVWVDQHGKRSMVSGKGADFYLTENELPREILQETQHLYLSAWSLFTNPPRDASFEAARIIREHGGEISVDPASFQMISECGIDICLELFKELQPSFLFPNYEEGKVLSSEEKPEKIVEVLAKLFPETKICLKLDAKGALIYDSGSLFHLAPYVGEVVDDTGAGDAFAGAFLSEYLQSGDVMSAGELAVCVSSWVVSKLGARPQSDEELEKRIREFKLHTI